MRDLQSNRQSNGKHKDLRLIELIDLLPYHHRLSTLRNNEHGGQVERFHFVLICPRITAHGQTRNVLAKSTVIGSLAANQCCQANRFYGKRFLGASAHGRSPCMFGLDRHRYKSASKKNLFLHLYYICFKHQVPFSEGSISFSGGISSSKQKMISPLC